MTHSSITSMTADRCSFTVSDVTPSTTPLAELDYHTAVARFLGGPGEACFQGVERLLAPSGAHPLIETLHRAFAWHHPVRLTPDVIWLTLMQGVAHHVNENAELLRRQFVKHDGKTPIIVRRKDFTKGSPDNNWPGVFPEFSDQVRAYVGPAIDWMLADFSTTTPVSRAASEITLLDAMHSYFSYTLITICGIPEMTLEGTPDDWRSIARRMREFSRFELTWWVDSIAPILDEFVAAREGRINRAFWESIYKFNGPQGSGDQPTVSGWAGWLFPYLQRSDGTLYRNPSLGSSGCSSTGGPLPSQIPALPAKAPFTWRYFFVEYEMEFIGGLLGVRQDADTLCLTPEIGWVVRERTPNRVELNVNNDIDECLSNIFHFARRTQRLS